jgi:hypothetical protein
MNLRWIVSTIAVGVLCLGATGGCSQDDGLTASQRKMAQDVKDWAKESGGDWNKLTPEQQKTMIESVGSEQSAKTVLQMKAHPPAPVQPGPPAGWKPGHAPGAK